MFTPAKSQTIMPDVIKDHYATIGEYIRYTSYLEYDNEHGYRAFFNRSDFPSLTIGKMYGLLIQFNTEEYFYDLGSQFEFTGNSLSYDGYDINYITSDGYYYDEDMDETICITCPMFSTGDWIAHNATNATIYIYEVPEDED